LSGTQAVAVEQVWLVPSHWRLQQSVATVHDPPGPLQVAVFDTQRAVIVSHACEQHWSFDVHGVSVGAHAVLPPAPAAPALPAAPPPPPWPPFSDRLGSWKEQATIPDTASAAPRRIVDENPLDRPRSLMSMLMF
jgi:hypothetical protein